MSGFPTSGHHGKYVLRRPGYAAAATILRVDKKWSGQAKNHDHLPSCSPCDKQNSPGDTYNMSRRPRSTLASRKKTTAGITCECWNVAEHTPPPSPDPCDITRQPCQHSHVSVRQENDTDENLRACRPVGWGCHHGSVSFSSLVR